MEISKITADYQATIPPEVRQFLGVGKGDALRFYIENNKVMLDKDQPVDRTRLTITEQALAVEWLSPEDEEAFKDW